MTMNTQTDTKDFVHVYTTYGHLAGDMVRLLLDSMGVPAFVLQESAGTTYGLTIGRLGEARIYVKAGDVQQAEQILRDLENGKLESSEVDYKVSTDLAYKSNKYTPGENFKTDLS